MTARFASGSIAKAICARCGQKIDYPELRADGDQKGLLVCGKDSCWDVRDPYKLPPHKPDALALRHPRPDEPLTCPPVPWNLPDTI